jgi:ubiquinone/menaquinone biosynthesis C-methylase UbiE
VHGIDGTVSGPTWSDGIHRVTRSRERARAAYDRASRWYGLVEEPFERGPRRAGLRMLAVRPGERVLDIGCGPGTALVELAASVRPDGFATGVDLSPAMATAAADRLRRAGLAAWAEVLVADAAALPWRDGAFDALFASFVLELIDTPEMAGVLAEWRRVLRPGGRLVVVGLSRAAPVSPMTRLYERLHDRFVESLDCRPIHVAAAIEAAGLTVARRRLVPLFGLRTEVVLAARPPEAGAAAA